MKQTLVLMSIAMVCCMPVADADDNPVTSGGECIDPQVFKHEPGGAVPTFVIDPIGGKYGVWVPVAIYNSTDAAMGTWLFKIVYTCTIAAHDLVCAIIDENHWLKTPIQVECDPVPLVR